MACIFERKTKDGETRYAALVRVKGYPRQTATFSRKTDAKLWAQHTESSIRSGKYFSQAEASLSLPCALSKSLHGAHLN